jgi:lipoprotein-anchoring transpeptidase ErfK/SrfK
MRTVRRFGGQQGLAACLLAFVLFGLAAQAFAGEPVEFTSGFAQGTIVVKTNERVLLLVTEQGKAMKYPIGVGRPGKQWFGSTRIISKHVRPAWGPPNGIGVQGGTVIAGGSPRNPLGAAALVLADQNLAIHGTNDPASIGGFVSLGCIRLKNEDITEMYSRVRVGTPVTILR